MVHDRLKEVIKNRRATTITTCGPNLEVVFSTEAYRLTPYREQYRHITDRRACGYIETYQRLGRIFSHFRTRLTIARCCCCSIGHLLRVHPVEDADSDLPNLPGMESRGRPRLRNGHNLLHGCGGTVWRPHCRINRADPLKSRLPGAQALHQRFRRKTDGL